MSDSPVMRLIPYLLAITVTVFVAFPVFNASSDLLLTLLVAVVAYFGTYYLTQFVIRLVARRNHKDERQ